MSCLQIIEPQILIVASSSSNNHRHRRFMKMEGKTETISSFNHHLNHHEEGITISSLLSSPSQLAEKDYSEGLKIVNNNNHTTTNYIINGRKRGSTTTHGKIIISILCTILILHSYLFSVASCQILTKETDTTISAVVDKRLFYNSDVILNPDDNENENLNHVVDCSTDFLHPTIIRNRTITSTRMSFIRGASPEEKGSRFDSLSTLQVDQRKLQSDDDLIYSIGHFSGSDLAVADEVVSEVSTGVTQGYWIIYQNGEMFRLFKVGTVTRNTKYYLYTMDKLNHNGKRRIALAGELPQFLEIAKRQYESKNTLMLFQFDLDNILNQPAINKEAELPKPIFPPPAIIMPNTIMGSVAMNIVKDIAYGRDGTLYFTGVFNAKLTFVDLGIVLESRKESSVFYGALCNTTGKVIYVSKVDPLPSYLYGSSSAHSITLSPNKDRVLIAGTMETMLTDIGTVHQVYIVCYDAFNTSAQVLWSQVIEIEGAKSVDDITFLGDVMLINVQLSNFSSIISQLSISDGSLVAHLIQYDNPYFGVRISSNSDNELVIVGKNGNVYSNIDWDSFITFGVQSSITLFTQKFTNTGTSTNVQLQQVYFSSFIKGSLIATQPLMLSTDSRTSRQYYVSASFSGNVQVIGDPSTVVSPIGFINALVSTVTEGCHSCNDPLCTIPLCGIYSQDDTRACTGRGKCTKPNTCSCSLCTFSGDTCQYPVCFEIPQNDVQTCSGNGRCAFPDYCICNENYTGKNCEIANCFGVDATNTSVCASNGACVARDVCKCYTNYTGENCGSEIVQGFTSCGSGRYLINQTDADKIVSPIFLYGYVPSLFISFGKKGSISYTGFGISSTPNGPLNGISIRYGSVLNSNSFNYLTTLTDQTNTTNGIIVTSVTTDKFDNTWVVGWRYKQQFGGTQYSGVMLKINDGKILVRKEFINVIPESIRITEDLSILITGGYRGSVEIDPSCTTTSSSLVNTIVFEIEPFNMVCLWIATSEGMSKGFSILPDSVGNVVISGVFKSAIRFEDLQIINHNSEVLSYYLLKFGPLDQISGNRKILWMQTITTNSSKDDNMITSDQFFISEFSSLLKFDPNRNILFSGEFGSYVSFQGHNVTSAYDRNFFLAKTDSNGFLQSMLTFQNVYNTTFDVDSSGFTYVSGVIKPGGSNVGDPKEMRPRFFASKYCVRNRERWHKETIIEKSKDTVYGAIYSAYSEADKSYVVAFYNKTLPTLPTVYTILFKDEQCYDCPAGTSSLEVSAFSNETCQLCPYGHYNPYIGAANCIACASSTYNPEMGSIHANSCILCEPGTFGTRAGQQYCEKCPKGEFSNSTGVLNCTACPIGTFAPVMGLTECQSCPQGQFTDLIQQHQCTSCDRGTYQPLFGQNSSISCLSCLAGTFNSNPGAAECTRCPAGTANSNTNSYQASDCKPCRPGSFSEIEGASVCTDCPLGTFNPSEGAKNASNCTACLPGTYANTLGHMECTSCSAGTYQPNHGSKSEGDCKLCPIGFYSNTTSSPQCFSCPTGMTTEGSGSKNLSVCIYCKEGFFLNGDYQCEICPFSTYSNVKGALKCSSCSLGLPTFTNGNTSYAACVIVPILIVVSILVILVVAIPIGIFAFMFRRQSQTLKRKKKAEDEMLSKLLEHNTKSSFYSSMDTTNNTSAHLIPIEDLEFKERVSEGAGGVIFRASWKGTEVAVKRIKSNQFGCDDDENFEHEANILTGLRHPNVVLLIGVSVDEDNKYIVTEFVKGGSLDKIIYPKKRRARNEIITFGRKLEILKDICRALIYLHNTKPPIIHRDLKPQNVLIDEAGNCKVCDFGVSKPLSSLTMTGVCYGTIQYTSPEILKQSKRYTVKCDVYSFAILMYELFFMVQPYTELPKSPFVKKEKSSTESSTNSGSQLSDTMTSSDTSTTTGHTTFIGSEMMSIFSIGSEVIQGRRPIIPWDSTSSSLLTRNNALQIQNDSSDVYEQDEDTLKCEWYLFCNKQKNRVELTSVNLLIPIVDKFFELMRKCWATDENIRPDFSEVLEAIHELEEMWQDVVMDHQ